MGRRRPQMPPRTSSAGCGGNRLISSASSQPGRRPLPSTRTLSAPPSDRHRSASVSLMRVNRRTRLTTLVSPNGRISRSRSHGRGTSMPTGSGAPRTTWTRRTQTRQSESSKMRKLRKYEEKSSPLGRRGCQVIHHDPAFQYKCSPSRASRFPDIVAIPKEIFAVRAHAN